MIRNQEDGKHKAQTPACPSAGGPRDAAGWVPKYRKASYAYIFFFCSPPHFGQSDSDLHCRVINKMHDLNLLFLEETHEIMYNKRRIHNRAIKRRMRNMTGLPNGNSTRDPMRSHFSGGSSIWRFPDWGLNQSCRGWPMPQPQATPEPSCICDLCCNSWQSWILNPQREAGDQTCILTDPMSGS